MITQERIAAFAFEVPNKILPSEEQSAVYRHSRTKRALELAIAVPLAVVTLPVQAAVAVAIKLDDGGPIFYGGKKGERRLAQIRRVSAAQVLERDDETNREELHTVIDEFSADEVVVRKFRSMTDGQVTRVGKFIRKWNLDELPQLWSVIQGSLSLVGDRPMRKEDLEAIMNERPIDQVISWLRGYNQGKGGIIHPRAAGQGHERKIRKDSDRYFYEELFKRRDSLKLDLGMIGSVVTMQQSRRWGRSIRKLTKRMKNITQRT